MMRIKTYATGDFLVQRLNYLENRWDTMFQIGDNDALEVFYLTLLKNQDQIRFFESQWATDKRED